jgi:hypothetical protein
MWLGLAGEGVRFASSAVGGLIFAEIDGTRGGVKRSLTGENLSGLIVLSFFGGEPSSSVLSLGKGLNRRGLMKGGGGPEGWKICG